MTQGAISHFQLGNFKILIILQQLAFLFQRLVFRNMKIPTSVRVKEIVFDVRDEKSGRNSYSSASDHMFSPHYGHVRASKCLDRVEVAKLWASWGNYM